MYTYAKKSFRMKAMSIIIFSAIVIISLCGFQSAEDITKKGVPYKFEGRITETVSAWFGFDRGLVVEKKPVTEPREKRIYVLVDRHTYIGFQQSSIKFKNLKEGMCIKIEGFKIIDKADNQEIIVVYAKNIEPIVQ